MTNDERTEKGAKLAKLLRAPEYETHPALSYSAEPGTWISDKMLDAAIRKIERCRS